MNKVDLRMSFWAAGGRVNVVAAKVASEVEGILDVEVGEVLLTECCTASVLYEDDIRRY